MVEAHSAGDVLTAHINENVELRVNFRVPGPHDYGVSLRAKLGAVKQHGARQDFIRVERVRVCADNVALMAS